MSRLIAFAPANFSQTFGSSSYLFATVLLLLCPTALLGQAGTPSFIPMDSHAYDSINLLNLNVIVHAPIYRKAGAMSVSIDWSANSYCTGATGTWQCGNQSPSVTNFGAIAMNQFMGGGANTGWATAYPLVATIVGCLNKGYSETKYSQWVVREANGTLHPLLPSDSIQVGGAPGQNCLHSSFTDTTIDGSGITVTASGDTGYSVGPIVTAGGVTINQAYPSATAITDANGNMLSIGSTQYNDTLGLTAATASPGVSAPTSVSWTDTNGGSPAVTITTANVKWQTNFGCTGFGGPAIAEVAPGISAPQFSGLTYPNGSSLSVIYEDTYLKTGYVTGRIKTLTLPTGGSVGYVYSGLDCSHASFDYLTRTTSDGTTTYSVTPNGSSYGAVTTVTDQGGNKSVYTFSTPSTYGNVVLTMMQVYKGTSTLLKQVNYCYNSDTSHCSASTATHAVVSFPIIQESVFATINGSTLTRESAYTFDSYGNTLTDAEYDFGVSSPATTTTITYGSWNSGTGTCGAVSATINNRVCESKSVDNASHTLADSRFTYDGNGNLIRTYQWSGSTWLSNTTANAYNTNGTVSDSYDLANNHTSFAYNGTGGCNGVFPTSVTTNSMTAYETWDCTGGVIKTRKDANGNVTTYGYQDSSSNAEPFWRVSSVTDPLSNEAWKAYSATSESGLLTFNSSLSITSTTGIVDSYGIPVRRQARQGPSASSYDTVSSAYTWSGNYRKLQTTMPCSASSGSDCSFASATMTKLADPLGRPYSITDADGGVDTFTYAQKDVLDVRGPAPSFDGENTKSVQTEYDGLGRVKSVCAIMVSGGPTSCGQANGSYSGVLTTYAYATAAGSQTVTATRGSQVRTKVFDALGRVTAITIPEAGTTHYYYDSSYGSCPTGYTGAAGQMQATVDPNGNVLCYKYDAMNRLTGVNANGTTCRHFYYDNSLGYSGSIPSGVTTPTNPLGRMVEAATDSCSSGTLITDHWFSYDVNGKKTTEWESTPNSGGYYKSPATYYANGALNTLSLTGHYTSTYTLDGEGRWNALTVNASTTVTATTYNAAGQPTNIAVGTTTDYAGYAYDNAGRMTNWTFSVGTNSETATPTWNPIGSLKELSITDGFNAGGTQDCKFGTTTQQGYDDLGRLLYDDCGSGGWGQSFSYDQFDNLKKAVISGRTGTTWNPTYSSSTNHITGNTYDSNGATTNDTFHTYEWNEFGKLKSIDRVGTGCVTSGSCLIYDALGRMVEIDSGSTKTEIWYTQLGKTAYMNGSTYLYAYFPSPGRGTAMHLSGGSEQYQYSDWLGSARLTSNLMTTIIDDRAFAPYGEMYNNFGTANANELIFTTDTSDALPGVLYDTPNRELNQSQGRWLSVDPAHSGWNGFAYGTDPNTQIDPSGLNRQLPGGGCDPDHSDCGSSGGAPSDPGAGGGTFDASYGSNGTDPSSGCPICTGPWGSLGTAGIAGGWASYVVNSWYGGANGAAIGVSGPDEFTTGPLPLPGGTEDDPTYFMLVSVFDIFGPQGNLDLIPYSSSSPANNNTPQVPRTATPRICGGTFEFGGIEADLAEGGAFTGVIHEHDSIDGNSVGNLTEGWGGGEVVAAGGGKITTTGDKSILQGFLGFVGLGASAGPLAGLQVGYAAGKGWGGLYVEGHLGHIAWGGGGYLRTSCKAGN